MEVVVQARSRSHPVLLDKTAVGLSLLPAVLQDRNVAAAYPNLKFTSDPDGRASDNSVNNSTPPPPWSANLGYSEAAVPFLPQTDMCVTVRHRRHLSCHCVERLLLVAALAGLLQ